MTRRARAVELFAHLARDPRTFGHARLEELVDLLLPEEPKPIDPEEAVARLVAAARAVYHTELSPEYFAVYQELANALEPFGGVGPEPEEDDG